MIMDRIVYLIFTIEKAKDKQIMSVRNKWIIKKIESW